MRRIRLTVAYDGTNYHGWQVQPGVVTIESVLNEALTELFGEEIAVIGASRTDSGVHARGNVAVFDTEGRMAADRICFALNQRLPEDIRVQDSCEVPPDWHPRKQRCVKTYEYKIINRRMELPDRRLYTYFYYYNLDLERMRAAAACLLGEHDFKSFCSAKSQVEDTVRTIYGLDIIREGDEITLRIRGNGFLYNMVRIIAGTLLNVGNGHMEPEEVKRILEAKDRRTAGPTAPAKGLTLVGMEYEDF
ncbi:MAG: tRNA pseudouridine(38-40) synthase TruA [Lachnospiraceae bacterium]|uniref:tRNA pseudouridine synthase A n=1 Tax=Candidatus Enterocloster excrementigallinarum TaxID=2838558 RepID=A0A9D2TEG7_9FIRM|nr:tRNA pseudouridine(38-40) synthase TruA [Lachnospiraceae bacterium]HJC67390.1 tRNA pseudouridine(38-40) synthase TruA [Candidatus Enterocloster excrementigallinarum]